MKVKDIAKHIEKWCPTRLAEDWDNVGLQVGDPNQEVKRVLVALDAIEEVIDEAMEKKIDLIVTHHPLMFDPVKRVTTETPVGKNIHKLIQNNISVYSAHTNLDSAKGGINDVLVERLELKNAVSLEYTVEIEGIGRVGELEKKVSLNVFADKTRDVLNLKEVRVVGNLNKMVKKIAICSGSGMSLLDKAILAGADVFLTGDVKYHNANDALASGISLIDAGHYGTENIIVPILKEYLQKLKGLEVIETGIDGDPFKLV